MPRKSSKALSFLTRQFGTAIVQKIAYQNGDHLAVQFDDENGEGLATLSINIPESAHLLGKGEFFAKTYSENETIAEDALASGIFRDTGRTSGGALVAPIWVFN